MVMLVILILMIATFQMAIAKTVTFYFNTHETLIDTESGLDELDHVAQKYVYAMLIYHIKHMGMIHIGIKLTRYLMELLQQPLFFKNV